MKKFYAFLFSVLLTTPIFAFAASVDSGLNFSLLERIVGVHGIYDAKEQLLKISVPRSDLNVTINGIKLSTAMGLTSWVTFKKVNATTTELAGSLALTEDQINQVMQTAIDNHLDVVELHNHLLWESPKIMFMHIEGVGDAKELATAVNKVFAKIRESSNGNGDFPVGEIDTSVSTFDKVELEKILGSKGKTVDGVYKISVDKQPLSIPSDDIAYISRVNIAATFAGNADNAVVDGDFALQEPNLQKVLTALHQAGITVVAINQRMSDNTNFVFLHYWAMGKPLDIARGLRRALDISQEVPAKVQLTKAETVQAFDPLNSLATDQNAHMPVPYIHLRAMIKQHALPRFALEPVLKTPELPPVPATLHWSLGKPSTMVSTLWHNLGVDTAPAAEIITENDMSLGSMIQNSFSALKANLKASALANQSKSFHWTLGKPSHMVTALWQEWSERPDMPDEPVATTRKTILLGAALPKPIILHRDMGKPSEYVHKLWANFSDRPLQPDNVLQYAIKSIRRPAVQEVALHKAIGKPSEYVQHLWFDLTNRKVELPVQMAQATIKIASKKPAGIPIALHKDIGKPSQYIEHLWFSLAHRPAAIPLPANAQAIFGAQAILATNAVALQKYLGKDNKVVKKFTYALANAKRASIVVMPTVIAKSNLPRINLHRDMAKPSEFVTHMWFDLANRKVEVITPVTIVSAKANTVPVVLHKEIGKPSQYVEHLWFDLANRKVEAPKVKLAVTVAKVNTVPVVLHKDIGKPSQYVEHLWFDMAHRKIEVTATKPIIVVATNTVPVVLHKDIGKPSQYVEHLWFDLANRKTVTPALSPQILAAGNKLITQSGAYIAKSAQDIGHYWIDLAQKQMATASVKPAFVAAVAPATYKIALQKYLDKNHKVVKHFSYTMANIKVEPPKQIPELHLAAKFNSYVSVNMHKEVGKPSHYIEHLWSDLANRSTVVASTATTPAVVKVATPYVSANMHKDLGKPSQYTEHLWSDLASRQTIAVSTTPTVTKVAQPYVSANIHKELGKPSEYVNHLWHDLAARKSAQPKTAADTTIASVQTVTKEAVLAGAQTVAAPVIAITHPTTPVEIKRLGKPSAMVHNLWQHLEDQQLLQQAQAIPNTLPILNKIYTGVARGVQDHMVQVQTRTAHQEKVKNAATLVHRLWQAMETPPPPIHLDTVSMNHVAPHEAHPYVSISARKRYFQHKTLMQNPLFPAFSSLPVVRSLPHNYHYAAAKPVQIKHVVAKTKQHTPIKHIAAKLAHGLPIKPLASAKSHTHSHLHVAAKKPHLVQAKLKSKSKHIHIG